MRASRASGLIRGLFLIVHRGSTEGEMGTFFMLPLFVTREER
jgi:hypothetical protein